MIKSLGIYLAMAGAMYQTPVYGNNQPTYVKVLKPEEIEAIRKKQAQQYYKNKKLKKFEYPDGITIFARGQENADRKYNNLMK